jgi:predicted lipid-binding transport protein (Tim44 family)
MDTPQFQKAEYGSAKSPDSCAVCKQPVGAAYYRINGAVTCESCATRAKSAMPASSHANFMRGLLFGIGGAILGLIIYATFTIATGIEIGYVSLAVGFIVGKAIKMGSKGFGGTHYQILAVLLTYAAVSTAAVPISISQMSKQPAPAVHTSTPSEPSSGPSALNPDSGAANTSDGIAATDDGSSPTPPKSFGMGILYLAFVGLASPFLDLSSDPVHGGIGVIILLVGMRIAWRLTSMDDHAQIVGPFKNSSAPATPPSLG